MRHWLSAGGAKLLGDAAKRGDAPLDFGAAGCVAFLQRLDELARGARRRWCGCRLGCHRAPHRLGASLREVESVGERVDGRHEVVDLVLQLGDGGGRVVGRFGFVAQARRR